MELDCGIPRRRLEAWLDDELVLERRAGAWVFPHESGTCNIALAPLPNRKLGVLDFERTFIEIAGDDRAIDAFIRQFTLRFASAGG